MLDSHGDLSIAVLVFYGIFIGPAIYVCIKHGFGRHLGWFYLVSLPIVRIVGAACLVAAEQKPSVGLYTAAAICNGIGLVPLLFVLTGFVKRINDGMPNKIPEPPFMALHLATIVGLALAIAGGVEAIPTNSPSEIKTGTSLRKASAIILFLIFVGLAVLMVSFFLKKSSTFSGDRNILYAGVASLPFVLVRCIYLMLLAFDGHKAIFNTASPNVYVQAFMQILMEFFAFGIFLAAGLTSDRVRSGGSDEEMVSSKPVGDVEHGEYPERR